MSQPSSHPNDPLHGVTLETVLKAIVDRHGWEEMSHRIPIRCFMFDPTIKSSLTFLRKNPWARKKIEDWYVYDVTRGWIEVKKTPDAGLPGMGPDRMPGPRDAATLPAAWNSAPPF